jgi:hypothetical protein
MKNAISACLFIKKVVKTAFFYKIILKKCHFGIFFLIEVKKCQNGISSENNMKKCCFSNFFHKRSEKNAVLTFSYKIV